MSKIFIRVLLIGLILVFILVTLLARFGPKQTEPTPTPTPSPTATNQSSYSQFKDIKNLESQPGFIKKETSVEGTTAYDYQAEYPGLYNQIFQQDGKTVLKTTSLFSDQKTFPSLLDQFDKYGQFEKRGFDRLTGLDLFIYPRLGIAIVGSEQADEARYLYEFQPQTLEEFNLNLSKLLIYSPNGEEL